ncbi:MAG: ClpXP protease specificity-enhancing factor [Burkholderiales bacterium]
MKELSTKPYMIRAIYEWCADSGYTPYIVVKVDRFTKVPMEYVKNGEIVLNLSPDATHKLTLGNDVIQFSARFAGVSREISIPVDTVGGIFAKETAQGLFFDTPPNTIVDAPAKAEEKNASDATPPDTDGSSPQNGGRRRLQVVK